MKWFPTLLLVFLPCDALAQAADPTEARPGVLAEPTGPSATKKEQARRENMAIVGREMMRRAQEWGELREAGTFLVPGALFPYEMAFAEGDAEAERLVGLIEAVGGPCPVVLAFERLEANVTRVQCGNLADPFNVGTPFDVVERGDGVSVYEIGDGMSEASASALVEIFAGMEQDDQDALPSGLADGRAAVPEVPSEGLPGIPAPAEADMKSGRVTLVNFWATWCLPCRAEHPTLKALAAEGMPIIGVNILDENTNASAYLADEGNPFKAVGVDPKGHFRIDWGVTMPPETFILDGGGRVLFRFVGPLIGADYENRFLPELRKAQGATGP